MRKDQQGQMLLSTSMDPASPSFSFPGRDHRPQTDSAVEESADLPMFFDPIEQLVHFVPKKPDSGLTSQNPEDKRSGKLARPQTRVADRSAMIGLVALDLDELRVQRRGGPQETLRHCTD
ncbi:hypothetical protein R5O87_18095 [Arthrobacter globiformis]|uniref:hypothetical protein n=1 Tax=Arthrobacter globiformis TaxID=1665 RepID=UPI00397E5672